jgi:5-methylcytosine-specific restriction endonuclease McrA
MSIATLSRRMADAGASADLIAIAIEEIEAVRVRIMDAAGVSPLAARVNGNGKVVRRKIPKLLRQAVIARDGLVCVYCEAALHQNAVHLDHKVPISRGGKHTVSNLCVSCAPCNHAKGTMTPEEFLA